MRFALRIACLTLALAVGLDAWPPAKENNCFPTSLGLAHVQTKSVTLRAASVGAEQFHLEQSANISAFFDYYSRHALVRLGLSDAAAANASDAQAATKNNKGSQLTAGITVDVHVGTPPQTQTVLLHFLSSNFWFYAFMTINNQRFDAHASTTYHSTDEQFKFGENDYNASGSYAVDNVQVGALRFKQQRIPFANASTPVFPLLGVAGVLGLTAAADHSGQSALADLLKDVKDPFITFYHNPLAIGFSRASNALFVTFGGADETLCENDWQAVDATIDGSWQVNVHGISINNNTYKNLGVEKALILSTFPVTIVPNNTLKHIFKALKAVKAEGDVLHTVKCSGLPTIHLHLGDHHIPIQPDSYIFQSGNVCFLAILEMTDELSAAYGGVQFVLADALLRSNCVKLDPHEKLVSFATPIPQPLTK